MFNEKVCETLPPVSTTVPDGIKSMIRSVVDPSGTGKIDKDVFVNIFKSLDGDLPINHIDQFLNAVEFDADGLMESRL